MFEKEISGMVTCPLNKEAIHAAGFVEDLGHQEILARLANVNWTATMLMTPGLKVAHIDPQVFNRSSAVRHQRQHLIENCSDS